MSQLTNHRNHNDIVEFLLQYLDSRLAMHMSTVGVKASGMTTYKYASVCSAEQAVCVLKHPIFVEIELPIYSEKTALYYSVIHQRESHIKAFKELAEAPESQLAVYKMCMHLTKGRNILSYAHRDMPGYGELYQLVVDAYLYFNQKQSPVCKKFLAGEPEEKVFHLGMVGNVKALLEQARIRTASAFNFDFKAALEILSSQEAEKEAAQQVVKYEAVDDDSDENIGSTPSTVRFSMKPQTRLMIHKRTKPEDDDETQKLQSGFTLMNITTQFDLGDVQSIMKKPQLQNLTSKPEDDDADFDTFETATPAKLEIKKVGQEQNKLQINSKPPVAPQTELTQPKLKIRKMAPQKTAQPDADDDDIDFGETKAVKPLELHSISMMNQEMVSRRASMLEPPQLTQKPSSIFNSSGILNANDSDSFGLDDHTTSIKRDSLKALPAAVSVVHHSFNDDSDDFPAVFAVPEEEPLEIKALKEKPQTAQPLDDDSNFDDFGDVEPLKKPGTKPLLELKPKPRSQSLVLPQNPAFTQELEPKKTACNLLDLMMSDDEGEIEKPDKAPSPLETSDPDACSGPSNAFTRESVTTLSNTHQNEIIDGPRLQLPMSDDSSMASFNFKPSNVK